MENVQGTYKLVKKASRHTFLIGLVGMLMSTIPYIFLIRAELWKPTMYLSILLVPFFVMSLVLIVHSFYYRVIITENTILLKLPSTNRSFFFDEIRGFKITPSYVYIYSNKKKISISIYTEGIDKIYGWLQQNFTNLDELPQEESDFIKKFNAFFDRHFSNLSEDNTTNFDNNDITSSESYKTKLKRAKYIVSIYNILSFFSIGWLFFYPFIYKFSFLSNYKHALILAVLLTIIGIILPKISTEFIYYSSKEEDKPYIRRIFFLLGMSLLIRFMLDVNLLDYYTTILLYSLSIGFFLTFFIMTSREFNFRQLKTYFQGLFFLLSFTAFGYGAIGIGNFLYDESIPKMYKAKILKREMYSGRVVLFSLKLDRWHETSDMNKIKISQEKY